MALQFETPKDPDEVLDYQIDWSARLVDDTIATSVFSLASEAGLVIDRQSHTDTISTVWLSAGDLGSTAEILCRITTAGLRTMDQTVKLKIRAK